MRAVFTGDSKTKIDARTMNGSEIAVRMFAFF
jgi:hypothetical protein